MCFQVKELKGLYRKTPTIIDQSCPSRCAVIDVGFTFLLCFNRAEKFSNGREIAARLGFYFYTSSSFKIALQCSHATATNFPSFACKLQFYPTMECEIYFTHLAIRIYRYFLYHKCLLDNFEKLMKISRIWIRRNISKSQQQILHFTILNIIFLSIMTALRRYVLYTQRQNCPMTK